MTYVISGFVLCFSLAVSLGASAASNPNQILFDGYYKLSLADTHIGFIAQRFEYNPKEKVFHTTYLLKTNKAGGDLQESLKATSNEKFEPIRYSYTAQTNEKTGPKVKTIDGSFKGETMKLIITDGKIKRDETHKIPKGTFLSSFLGFLMLQKGISIGKKYSYSGIAEEDGNSYNGEALVKEKTEYLGQAGFRILNKFKGSNFVSFMNEKGEVLGTRSEESKISSELVKEPSEATKGFALSNSTLSLVFGSIPTGKVNAFHSVTEKPEATPQPSKKGP